MHCYHGARVKAIGLLSGGLDSILAVKLILEQNIKIIGLKITTPFMTEKKDYARLLAENLNIPLKTISCDSDYFRMVKKPKYGYGVGLNPCLDCRIYFFKKAKFLAKKLGAKFIITGEVLGQRPMSQYHSAMDLTERKAGLKGKILRPLSAKLLAPTEAEKNGWVNREKLLDICGRSRKQQFELAKKWGIKNFSAPAGGCLLTDKNFVRRLRDLWNHKKQITLSDIDLLKIGRHFRFDKNKIIVGRNQEENKKIVKLKNKSDYIFETIKYPGPTTILQGPKTKQIIEKAVFLTAYYSDAPKGTVQVCCKTRKKLIFCQKILSAVSLAEISKHKI